MVKRRFIKGKPMKWDKEIGNWVPEEYLKMPIDLLIQEYSNLIYELSEKEIKFAELEDDYCQKEFNIKFVEDIDFKTLYGKANDDTRKHHARVTLKDLRDEKKSVELSVDYLKRRISFFNRIISVKYTMR